MDLKLTQATYRGSHSPKSLILDGMKMDVLNSRLYRTRPRIHISFYLVLVLQKGPLVN